MEKKAWGFNQLYTVVFYEGGKEKGEWMESQSFYLQADAFKHQREINDGGRAAYVYDRYQLEMNGLPTDPPVKWDFEKLKWKDEVTDSHSSSIPANTNNDDPRAVPAEETALFYRNADKNSEMGCIGYVRGDFGSNGKGFWTTWFDGCSNLKIQGFRNELDDVINRLRDDGMLKDFSAMSNYCNANSQAKLGTSRGNEYGFKVETENHSYYIRGIPTKGDYNFYCFCYNRPMLEEYLGAAQGQQDENQSMTMGGL